MSENLKEKILWAYENLDKPAYNPNTNVPGLPNLGPMGVIERRKRRKQMQDIIGMYLKEWNIKYNWGFPETWYNDVKKETSSDINIWATPERLQTLERQQIEHKSFINGFFSMWKDALAKLGGVLTWPILAPFKNAMKKGLKDAGQADTGSLQTIAKRFFDRIVKKRKPENDMSGFEDSRRHFTRGSALANFEKVEPVSATVIISAIMEFFKLIQNGAKDKSEQDMAEIAARDSANAQALIDAELRNNKEEDDKMDFSKIFKWLLVAVGLFLLYKYATKGNS